MWRVILLIGLGLALAGGLWWRLYPAHPGPVESARYETDMTEGLVREILTELPPLVPPVCFLAFGDGTTPPSGAFIARFAGSRPAVRSCGSAAAPATGEYFETSTGRPGLIVHIVDFQEYSPGTFDVVVSFSNLPAGHDRFSYRISGAGGDWVVKRRRAV